ncbi:hypothetical protein DPEC_G00329200 [Dallia pectoralis]|uniref:Uncharacterized protein n=1 Tax=Dallia pectoralis TaxID=75939 RepID=A0ACC2F8L5_DALPE|nr:hypothetical protein DPEC_G00329200 [Dallia pectoralis]
MKLGGGVAQQKVLGVIVTVISIPQSGSSSSHSSSQRPNHHRCYGCLHPHHRGCFWIKRSLCFGTAEPNLTSLQMIRFSRTTRPLLTLEGKLHHRHACLQSLVPSEEGEDATVGCPPLRQRTGKMDPEWGDRKCCPGSKAPLRIGVFVNVADDDFAGPRNNAKGLRD